MNGLFSKENSQGFTLLELLLVVAIMLMLAAGSTPIYGKFFTSSQLNESSAQILQTLRTARGRSVARLNNTPHGVFFEVNSGSVDRYILYQGQSYISRDASYDVVTELEEALSLSTTLAGNELVFSLGHGEPSESGTITITHTVFGSRSVSITSLGKVEEN